MDDADKNPAEAAQVNEAKQEASARPRHTIGRLIHRTEPEIKTHTSYLVFAVMPQEWSEEQEAAAFARWPCGQESRVIGKLDKESRKKEKRELLQTKSKRKRDKDDKTEADETTVAKRTRTAAEETTQ